MIYIVIAVFNRLSYTKSCLCSLLSQNFPEFKIIVVDHGSTDGTSTTIQKEFPGVVLLNESDNLWWAGATNRGIEKAISLSRSDEDFILTLNNDLVVEPEYLRELLDVYNTHKPAIIGSLCVDVADVEKVDFAGVRWNNIHAKYKKNPEANIPFSALKKEHKSLPTDLLPGRGTLFPMKVFTDFGGFDENNFPHYAADLDFALICKKKGYKLLVAVNAYVKSHVNETGVNFALAKLGPKQFFKSLSSLKSANNISTRYKWAKKNSPVPLIYFLADISRIFVSYFRSIIKYKALEKHNKYIYKKHINENAL